MKYLLSITIVFYVLTFCLWKAADRPGDDFGAAVPFILSAVVSVILTVTYLSVAAWNHTFF